LLLLCLGAASLAVALIIGLQILAVPRMGIGLGRSSFLIPAWGVVAIGLALGTRRKAESFLVRVISVSWLLIAATAAIGAYFNFA
jgi:hypothetical protein